MKTDFLYEGLNPVIMLAENAKELTEMAVDSVVHQDIPVLLTLICNDCIDGTEEWAERHPNLASHNFKPGLGVSAGWNFGLTQAFRHFDYCLVCNNDIILRNDTYQSLIEDGGEFVTAVAVADPIGIVGHWRKAPRPNPDFSCFLIRKSVWERVGGFDEHMKLYASDNDYHLRMHEAGIEAKTIGIPFYHVASGTLKYATPTEKSRIQRQADLDRAYFESKWGCEVGSVEYYRRFGQEPL